MSRNIFVQINIAKEDVDFDLVTLEQACLLAQDEVTSRTTSVERELATMRLSHASNDDVTSHDHARSSNDIESRSDDNSDDGESESSSDNSNHESETESSSDDNSESDDDKNKSNSLSCDESSASVMAQSNIASKRDVTDIKPVNIVAKCTNITVSASNKCSDTKATDSGKFSDTRVTDSSKCSDTRATYSSKCSDTRASDSSKCSDSTATCDEIGKISEQIDKISLNF